MIAYLVDEGSGLGVGTGGGSRPESTAKGDGSEARRCPLATNLGKVVAA